MHIIRNTIFSVIFLLLAPGAAKAAVLYMQPAEGTYGPGDTVSVDIKVDIQEACINTADIFLDFPKERVRVKDFLTGESIISIWVEKPGGADIEEINQNGLIHFSGGMPGGFCGRVIGDPGFSNILATIVFEVPSFTVSETEANDFTARFMENTKIYLNDGLGTLDKLIVKNGSFVLSKTPSQSDNRWQEAIANDQIRPEPFMIEVHQSDKMFNGKYYVIFYTTDKQTGVDHYELQEQSINELISEAEKPWWQRFWPHGQKIVSAYRTVEIPYVLEDQTLTSIIRVKAIDKAGNERIEEYTPPESMRPAVSAPFYARPFALLSLLGILIAVTFVFAIFIIKKKRTHAQPKANQSAKP